MTKPTSIYERISAAATPFVVRLARLVMNIGE